MKCAIGLVLIAIGGVLEFAAHDVPGTSSIELWLGMMGIVATVFGIALNVRFMQENW